MRPRGRFSTRLRALTCVHYRANRTWVAVACLPSWRSSTCAGTCGSSSFVTLKDLKVSERSPRGMTVAADDVLEAMAYVRREGSAALAHFPHLRRLQLDMMGEWDEDFQNWPEVSSEDVLD